MNKIKYKNNNSNRTGLFLILAFLIGFSIIAIASIGEVEAADLYVNASGGSDSNSGTTINNPHQSINKSIETINNGGSSSNSLTIGSGTFQGSKNKNIVITKNVNIYSAKYRGLSSSETILDAQGNGNFFTVQNGVTVNFYGITFNNGKTDHSGGAIEIGTSNVNINNCKFNNNIAGTSGGAIYITGSNNAVKISNSVFNNNEAENLGGAICVFNNGNINIINSNFTNNYINFRGGAIYIGSNSIANIDNCIFEKNMGYDGGAIGAYSAQINITGSTFKDNYGINGGAVFFRHGTLDVNNCVLSNNTNNQIWINASDNTIANHNWWGSNNGQTGINSNVDNWFVIENNNLLLKDKSGKVTTVSTSKLPTKNIPELKTPTVTTKKTSKLLVKTSGNLKYRKLTLKTLLRNYGPNKLKAVVTLKLRKGVSFNKVKIKNAKYKVNKKKRTITLNFNIAKTKKKLPTIRMTLNTKYKYQKYFTTKVKSSNKVKLVERSKVKNKK